MSRRYAQLPCLRTCPPRAKMAPRAEIDGYLRACGAAFLGVAIVIAGCGTADKSSDESRGLGRPAQIVGGTPATTHGEAALVDMFQGGSMSAACSGAVIAPRVVLTAGHCVDGFDGWEITTPYAGHQKAKSSHAEALDWIGVSGESVDPSKHDVGLVILDSPITLDNYPEIAKSPLGSGGKAVNIGRIGDGAFSSTDLFESKPLGLRDASGDGFPFDYIADEIIQSGDSGGPVEAASTGTTHVIVAVNSGAGGGTEVLARTDLVYDWIQKVIAANGGGGGGGVVPDAGPPDGGGGTPGDEDSDGIPDANDLCSRTPHGEPVWTAGEWIGCAAGQHRDGGGGADTDRDGVPDNKDHCTHTPAGAPVWPYGQWIGCAAGEHRDW